MRTIPCQIGGVLLAVCLLCACQQAVAQGQLAGQGPEPKVVRDVIWVWGNPEMATEGKHTLATFAQAPPAERATLLGVPNVIMAGHGLPNDDQEADALTAEVADFPRLRTLSHVKSRVVTDVQGAASHNRHHQRTSRRPLATHQSFVGFGWCFVYPQIHSH